MGGRLPLGLYLYSLGKSPFASGGTPPVASAGWWGGARVYCATESHTPDPSSSTRQCIYFVSTFREKKRRALTTCSLLSRQPGRRALSCSLPGKYALLLVMALFCVHCTLALDRFLSRLKVRIGDSCCGKSRMSIIMSLV